ncbi:MAG: pimeloyl-ACP methyl ester esterase BioH [Gammaproteobacteria bacterium]|nr:pimeloyl-ACP methyl ester esterase BioH [Gammaproteobacteria bacterium]
MSLYVETTGSGPELVLLHGWGLHGGVWDGIAPRLAERFTLHRVDLPGHGASHEHAGPYDLEAMARLVLEVAPGSALWMGWSLGGEVALQAAALAPERIQRLIMVASSPRFLASGNWPGVSAEVLQGFADSLERDYRSTLQRFLALQARGSDHAREEIRQLREGLFSRGEPSMAALREGLTILQQADLLPLLADITQDTLFVGGERDTLVPAEALQRSAAATANGRYRLIPGAGHAPFLSHAEAFLHEVEQFLI